MMLRFAVLAVALLFVAMTHAAPAAPAASPAPSPSPGGPVWDMKTKQMDANMRSGVFSAPTHVLLVRSDGSTVNADRANGNYKQHQATLIGHVVVLDKGGTFGLRSASGVQGRGPATLTSDQLHLDDRSHTFDATGSVHYEQGDTTVDAQTAHLDDVSHELDLSGKVHVVQGARTIDAEHATYNTQTGQGGADKDVTIQMPGPSPSIATPKPINVKEPKIP